MSENNGSNQKDQKRAKVSQTEYPNVTLQQALRIPHAIWDNFAGKGAAPFEIAMAVEMSPTSGTWRNLCGAAIAYGLTEGGYAANEITLSDLGRRIVAPMEEGDDARAVVDALLKPRVLREFALKYDKAKFPKDEIAKNVLVGMGLPKERSEKALDILKENAKFAGIVHETKTGPFVALGSPALSVVSESHTFEEDDGNFEQIKAAAQSPKVEVPAEILPTELGGNRVFITHGKNKEILEQVKKIVKFGKFDPVVAQENVSVSKPVPSKVLDEMRSCHAGVIHVGSEGSLIDSEGNEVPGINGNVLIEIGAAMALYKGNFVLLVEDGLELPSNLQGLYECRYTGDKLSAEATMQLLEAFTDFK